MRLREPEPVVIAHREGHVGPLEVFQRRDDIEQGEALHPPGMVDGQPVRDPGDTVMAGKKEAAVAKMLDDLDHVLRHLVLRVGRMAGGGGRLEGTAIAAQVRADDRVSPGQLRRDLVPHGMCLRIAM